MLKAPEHVPEAEMVTSIYHLLQGRAKLWYLSIIDYGCSWEELIRALKEEFLPKYYDYQLFCEISNRAQKPQESFAEYVTRMNTLFKCLSIPVSEQHRLFIVQKNILPRYAQAVVPFELATVAEPTAICNRVDNRLSST